MKTGPTVCQELYSNTELQELPTSSDNNLYYQYVWTVWQSCKIKLFLIQNKHAGLNEYPPK